VLAGTLCGIFTLSAAAQGLGPADPVIEAMRERVEAYGKPVVSRTESESRSARNQLVLRGPSPRG